MKKIYTIFLLLAMSTTVGIAQNSKTKKADKHYDRLEYNDAAAEYAKLIKKGETDPYVYERLGNSYYFINDTKNAALYYKNIVNQENVDSEIVYNYAQSLKANGNVSEYNTYMKKFADMKPSDSRAVAFMKNPNYLPKIVDEDRQKFTAENAGDLNTELSDFGGRMYNGDIYYTSVKDKSRNTYSIYRAAMEGGVPTEGELLKGDVVTKLNESTPAITADGKRMYFDRNDYIKGKIKRDKEGITQMSIYYVENVDGKWKDIKSVPFNSKEFSNSHPALSPDGNFLYFTSDREGGIGKADIYRVSISSDGSFGEPENLGSEINTEGREGFPYLDSNGTLYFSSDGHLGMGGLDVFSAEAQGNGFAKPKNMGLGINSSSDDFAFYHDPATGEGFVSSNREGGMGSDDIYFTRKIESCELIVNVMVVDATTDQPLSGVRLDLYDGQENKLKTQNADNNGSGRLIAACDQEHVIQAFKEGYESNAETIPSSKNGTTKVRIALRPIDQIVEVKNVKLNPILFDFDRHNIKPQAAFELDKLVELMKKNQNMQIEVEAHTDSRGNANYNMNLSDKRARSTVQYVISKGISKDRISGKGFGESRPAVDCGDDCTEEQHQMNRRSEFIIVKE